MSDADAAARDRTQAQRYRNLVAALVIGAVIVGLAVSYVLLLPGATGVAGALCTFGFLAVAFVAWEYLMKPGYGFLHRGEAAREEEAPPTARKVPRSPRPP